MKALCRLMDDMNWRAVTKFRVVCMITGLISAVIGIIIWSIIRTWGLSTYDWMVCFMGYPAVISWFVVYIRF